MFLKSPVMEAVWVLSEAGMYMDLGILSFERCVV